MNIYRIFETLFLAVVAAMTISCIKPETDPVESLKPTIAIEVGEITSSGCDVVFTLSEKAACYRTINISAARYSALDAAQIADTIASQPAAYVTEKRICKLYESAEYVIAAIPYAADGTAGTIATANYTLGEFAMAGSLYTAENADHTDRTVYNTIYARLYTSGRALSGRYAFIPESTLIRYQATYNDESAARLLADFGKDFTAQQLEDIDSRDAQSSYIAYSTGLDDDAAYSFLVSLTDFNGIVHNARYDGSTEEIVLLDEYKRYLGTYTQRAVTWMTVNYPAWALKDITLDVKIKVKNQSFTVTGLSKVLSEFDQNLSLDLQGVIGGSATPTVNDSIEALFNAANGKIELHPQKINSTYKGNYVRFYLIEGSYGLFNSPYENYEKNYSLSGLYDDDENNIVFGGYKVSTRVYDGYTFIYDKYNGTGSESADFAKVGEYVSPRLITWTKVPASAPSSRESRLPELVFEQ